MSNAEAAPPALATVRDKLGKKYLSGTFIKILQDVRAPKLDVRDVYVDVTIVEAEDVRRCCDSRSEASEEALFLRLGQAASGEKIALSDLFHQAEGQSYPVNTVALVGPAGGGKTMVATKKLPVQWVDGSGLVEVVLLFVIHVRNVLERSRGVGKEKVATSRVKSVQDLIKLTHRELRTDDLEAVMAFLRDNDDDGRVMFVIDGLDEANIAPDSVLFRLITRQLVEISPCYQLLLTARPCPAVQSLMEIGIVDRHVNLCGFDRDARDAFFDKYGSMYYRAGWSTMRHNLAAFLRQLEAFNLAELTYLPLIATLTVHAIPSGNDGIADAPQCGTHLLQLLLMGILKRDTAVAPRRFSRFSHMRGEQLTALQALARQAFAMTKREELVFEDCGAESSEPGGASVPDKLATEHERLLSCLTLAFDGVDEDTGETLTMRQFVHLSVQEILCAYHLSRMLAEGKLSLFRICLNCVTLATRVGERFTQVHIFLAGLVTAAEAPTLFYRIMMCMVKVRTEVECREHRIALLVRMLAEAYRANADADNAKLRSDHQAIMCDIGRVVAGFMWAEAPSLLARRDSRDVADLVTVLKLARNRFHSVVVPCPQFLDPLLCRKVLQAIVDYQPDCRHVSFLWPGRGGDSPTADLPEEEREQTCNAFTRLVATNHSLEHLEVICNASLRLSDSVYESLCSALGRNISVHTLTMLVRTTPPHAVASLAAVLASKSNITRLRLDMDTQQWNPVCDVIISNNDIITHLDLILHWQLNGKGMRRLAHALGLNRTLQDFSCGGFESQTGGPEASLALCAAVQSHPSLKTFTLDCCFAALDDASLATHLTTLMHPSAVPPLRQLVITLHSRITVVGLISCLELLELTAADCLGFRVDLRGLYDLRDDSTELETSRFSFLHPVDVPERKTDFNEEGIDELLSLGSPSTSSAPSAGEKTDTKKKSPMPSPSEEPTGSVVSQYGASEECPSGGGGVCDPWLHADFRRLYTRILSIDPELLRVSAVSRGCLDDVTALDLATSQCHGSLTHNEKCLEHVRRESGGGRRSFRKLLDILEHIGYAALCAELQLAMSPVTRTSVNESDRSEECTTAGAAEADLAAQCRSVSLVDPWLHASFSTDFHEWILSLEPDSLRRHARGEGLLSHIMSSKLLSRQRAQGTTAHNELFLIYVKPDGLDSFLKFLKVIGRMGPPFRKRFERLLALLPKEHRDHFLSDRGTD